MSKRIIQINFNAEYQVSGLDTASNLVIVFHGYGQLAKYFIQKFRPLNQTCRIVAPQGLSRFYLEGFYGRVGATWMTKEERETDIFNYLTYIREVTEKELENCPKDAKVHLIGFSQGAATATRFAMNTQLEISSLSLWAGIFPPDLNFPHLKSKLENIPVSVILGRKDQFINDDRMIEMSDLIKKIGIEPDITWYDGAHTIEIEPLIKLKDKLGL